MNVQSIAHPALLSKLPPTPGERRSRQLNAARPAPWTIIWASPELEFLPNRPHDPERSCRVRSLWWCPVCSAPIRHPNRPGRHRVYCTNACKQRAYRARRLNRRTDPVPQRAAAREVVHAIRGFRDVNSGRRSTRGLGVTVCGTFARMSIDSPERFGHTRFIGRRMRHPNAYTSSCQRCCELTGVDRTDSRNRFSPGGP